MVDVLGFRWAVTKADLLDALTAVVWAVPMAYLLAVMKAQTLVG